jgi:hypothetical protein
LAKRSCVEPDHAFRSAALDFRAVDKNEVERFLWLEFEGAPDVVGQNGIARATVDEEIDVARLAGRASESGRDVGEAHGEKVSGVGFQVSGAMKGTLTPALSHRERECQSLNQSSLPWPLPSRVGNQCKNPARSHDRRGF